MRTNIFAITEPDCNYPAYASLNQDEAGINTLTVRSRGNGGTSVGSIALTDDQLRALAQNITEHLAGRQPPVDNAHVAPGCEQFKAVTMITFDGFVQHGRDQGVPLTNGMPWSFTYNGQPVTHENDKRYLVGVGAKQLDFTPDHVLYTLESGEMELRPVL